jgi:soluble lytic murein transglycosylase-like protein
MPDFSDLLPRQRTAEFSSVMLWLFFLAQDPQAIRAAMENSLTQQRASIQKQAQSIGNISIPWVDPAPVIALADCDPVPAPQLAKMIDETSQKQGVDKNLIREVARQESGFKPCAVSNKGAQGLMQLMPQTQAQFQVADPFDPKESLDAGTKLLKQLLDRYDGDLTKALSAYNAGARKVDQAGGVPGIPETQNYVLSILTRYLQ